MANDDFSDIPEAASLGGIFAGDGLSDYNTVRTKLTPQGLDVSTHCEGCGRGKKITVSFPELIYMANGRQPPEWYYDSGMWRWGRGCNCSGQVRPYPFGLTRNECQAAVDKALSYAYLSPQQVQQVIAHLQSQPAAR